LKRRHNIPAVSDKLISRKPKDEESFQIINTARTSKMEHTSKQQFFTPHNFLKAVFWDTPRLCNPESVRSFIEQAKKDNDKKKFYWIMSRFLERGRVKDTKLFFRPNEIKETLRFLKLSSRARKRWERLVQVYGYID